MWKAKKTLISVRLKTISNDKSAAVHAQNCDRWVTSDCTEQTRLYLSGWLSSAAYIFSWPVRGVSTAAVEEDFYFELTHSVVFGA